MTSSVILSNKDTFANSQLLEKFNTLPKIQVHTFGVRGKHFVLIKKKSGFLTRIWYSFLKFLRIIKTDTKSIDRLKNAIVTHLNGDDYKEWAKAHGKVTKLGIANLVESHQTLTTNLKEREETLAARNEHIAVINGQVDQHTQTIQQLNRRIADLEAERDQLRRANATAPQHSEQDANEVRLHEIQLNSQIEELTRANSTLKARLEKHAAHKKAARAKKHAHKSHAEVSHKETEPGLLERIGDAFTSHHHHEDDNHVEESDAELPHDDAMERVAEHLETADKQTGDTNTRTTETQKPKEGKRHKTIRRSDLNKRSFLGIPIPGTHKHKTKEADTLTPDQDPREPAETTAIAE